MTEEGKKTRRKKLIRDLVLALVLLSVSALLLVIMKYIRDDGSLVRVTQNNAVIAEYSLNTDATYSLNDGTNTLVIKDGFAYISEANCPDKVCINMGKISLSGERIVCLPNKLMVEIMD